MTTQKTRQELDAETLASMAERREIAQERTLARLADNVGLDDRLNTWAVVVDSTEPVEMSNKNWTVRLKVVDPSLNFKKSLISKEITFYNYAIVSFYSPDRENLPQIITLGEIVRLRRFSWHSTKYGELAGFQQVYSNWLSYEGTGNKQVPISRKADFKSNMHRKLTLVERDRLKELRKWVFDFFSANSVRQITWWADKHLLEDGKLKPPQVIQGADLVLQYQGLEPHNKKQLTKYVDEMKHVYTMITDEAPIFTVGQVIKFRSVEVTVSASNRVLAMLTSSTLLIIPNEFLDAKAFDSDFYKANKQKFSPCPPARRLRGTGGFQTKEAVLAVYPFLKSYYFEDFMINKPELASSAANTKIISNMASIIHKDYNNKLPVQLAFLAEIKGLKLRKFRFEKFLIHVKLGEFKFDDWQELFHLLCTVCEKTRRVTGGVEQECCGEQMQLCLFCQLHVKDESYSADGGLPLYVMAKSQARNPFALWDCVPDLDDRSTWQNFDWSKFRFLKAKLSALRQQSSLVPICVQARETQSGKHFLEIESTYFLP